MRLLKASLALAAIAAVTQAHAADDSTPHEDWYNVSATVGTSEWSGTRMLDSKDVVFVASILAKATVDITSDVTAVVDGMAASADAVLGNTGKFAIAREAYLGFVEGMASVQVGAVLVPWGRVDTINPTDNLVVPHYTWLTQSDTAQKTAPLGFRVRVRNDDGQSFEVVAQPVFQGGDIPLPQNPSLSYRDNSPSETMSLGLKYGYTGESISWSASYFVGPSKRPYLAPDPTAILTAGKVDLEHPMINVLGADFEMPVLGLLLRGEGAMTYAHRFGLDGITAGENNFFGVLELEKDMGSYNFFGELLYRRNLQYRALDSVPLPLQPFAHASDTVNDVAYKNLFGIGTGFVYNSGDGRWALSGDAAYFPALGDVSVRPRIHWHITDNVGVVMGGDLIRGSSDGPLGRLSRNSVAYVGFERSLLMP